MAAASYRRDVTEAIGDGSCRQHHSLLRRYCKQCSEAACDECVIARHSRHDKSVVSLSEYAQEVKQNTMELLALASNLPFFRIKYAAKRIRNISEKKKDILLDKVDLTAESPLAYIQENLQELDAMKQRVTELGINVLNNGSVYQEVATTTGYLETVDTVLGIFKENPTSTGIGLEFVGMTPDGSIGGFIVGGINIIGNVVSGRTITYIADNRRRDSLIIIGSGSLGSASVSKWDKSFCVIDQQNRIVFSSQVRSRGEEKLLLLALGHTIYKIDTSLGRCISEQIDTIHVTEGVILSEGAFSISGIDWFPENDGSLAVISFNIGKSVYLVDVDTKTLVRSFSTAFTNPSVISCRKVGNDILTIASDNTRPFRFGVINGKGTEEFRFSPCDRISGYTPWIACWMREIAPIRMAVVWCGSKPQHPKIMIYDGSGRVIQEVDMHGIGSSIPISIAYNPTERSFAMCSKNGICHVPVGED